MSRKDEQSPVTVPPMRIFGDPVLRERAREVERFDDPLAKLAEDLLLAMREYVGVGVAGNQIGALSRIFVYDDGTGPRWLVNPEIVEQTGEQELDEGCLSIPGLYFPVKRSMHVVAKGYDLKGDPVTVEGEELLARILQHETDHLDGMLFADRLSSKHRREMMKQMRERDLGAEAPRGQTL